MDGILPFSFLNSILKAINEIGYLQNDYSFNTLELYILI